MNREEAKEILPIIKAFAEGKTIQMDRSIDPDTEIVWKDVDNINALCSAAMYRIKPESKYRPFKDAEECWKEMLKHQPFGWVKNHNDDERLYNMQIFIPNTSDACCFIHNIWRRFGDMYNDYIFADGAPFGIKVEED